MKDLKQDKVNQNEIEQTGDIRKDLKDQGKKVFGSVEKDTLPKTNVIIDDQVVYKAGKVITFETADRNSLMRELNKKRNNKILRDTFPGLAQKYIFNSNGFEGTFAEYIVNQEDISMKEILEMLKTDERFKIPSVMSKRTTRQPEKDKWY